MIEVSVITVVSMKAVEGRASSDGVCVRGSSMMERLVGGLSLADFDIGQWETKLAGNWSSESSRWWCWGQW